MARKKRFAVVGKYCVACGACAETCKISAISVYKGMFAKVDTSKCIGCGMCAKACPAGEIHIYTEENE